MIKSNKNSFIFILILILASGYLFFVGIPDFQKDFSLKFDGANDYVSLPQINAGEQFTLEGWFYPTSTSIPWMTLFKDDWKGTNLGSFYLHPVLIGNQVDLSWWWGEKDMLYLHNLNINTWYYFVFTADGENTTMYAITDYQSWKKSVQAVPSFNNELKIGETDDGTFYKGQIDDIKIYNRALSEEEIKEHYQKIYKNETGLLGFWNFNEGKKKIVYDNSDNENDGIISGPVYVSSIDKMVSHEGKIKKTPKELFSTNEYSPQSLVNKTSSWFKNLINPEIYGR